MLVRRLLSCLAIVCLTGVPATAGADEGIPPQMAERRVGELLDGLGLSWGTVVNSWDIEEAAAVLGVEVEAPVVPVAVARRFGLDAMDLWREMFVRSSANDLMSAYRARLAEPARALGLHPGTHVDDLDVRRLAERVGLDMGYVIDPVDVTNLLARANRAAGFATPILAKAGPIDLHLPGHQIRGVGFHEAPRGEHRFTMQPVDHRAFVMPSRGRRASSTSAVDVAMPVGEDVVAPVTGVVTEVVTYQLYGRYQDAYVRIAAGPRDVMVLHLYRPMVHEGQHVTGGVTPIASGARVFPFDSQVEDFIGRHPHVDITVRPAARR